MSDFPWKNAQCVVTCGGKGSRLWPLTLEKQKSILEIGGKPIIGYVIDFWRQFVADFIFIIGHGAGEVVDFVKKQPIRLKFVNNEEGLAKAVLAVEPLVADKFVLVLGDCLVNGEFVFPGGFERGVGVFCTADAGTIKRSYSIEVENDKIKNVVEKQTEIINDL